MKDKKILKFACAINTIFSISTLNYLSTNHNQISNQKIKNFISNTSANEDNASLFFTSKSATTPSGEIKYQEIDTDTIKIIGTNNLQVIDPIFKDKITLLNAKTYTKIQIGDDSFAECQGLSGTLTFSNAIISLQSQSFQKCNNLTNITLNNNLTKIPSYCFFSCLNLETINLENIVSIESGAFSNCKKLKNINLNDNLITISDSTFQSCTSLETINLENVVNITNNAFQNCISLKSVNLKKVPTIGNNAFQNCANLQNIIFSNSLIFIGENAFNSCAQLEDVSFNWDKDNIPESLNNQNWLTQAVGEDKSNVTIYVPASALKTYKESTIQTNLNILGCKIIGTGITNASSWISGINSSGKLNYQLLDENTINITSVNDIDITNPIINSYIDIAGTNTTYNVSTINTELFENQTKLKGVLSISSDIISIGAYAFNNCSQLNTINLNWTKKQLEEWFKTSNTSQINPNWLGNLNNFMTKINVSQSLQNTYIKYAKQLGIDKCQIGNDYLALILGLSLGIGIPFIIATIVGTTLLILQKHKTKEK